ncbi:DUF1097 domain-containing protein [Secundilactobacillus silagei]|uniref:DUF1097 domain-containing protein n=1 Tax=Secundilactobacillus silagei JCM 19001 TaxID=1302250 RepID=A0A1Z5IIN7_9LACO|nr:DUF1097 domain-containing protein [Secundilactobacillus silagei]TDG73097.1 hypothetical protein C5L25_000738 [Secundilactobacillus silagei JCM 19001]GAX01498.1 hypothetical protein IWT126_01539 [Secundilactobacillus silagei JCM 19001]
MKISKDVWISSIGVGLTTLIFCLIAGVFNLWMSGAAFIAASYFFGAGAPMDKVLNISVSFLLGIALGCFCLWLLALPHLGGLITSSVILGFLTFLVLFLQGTIMKFAEVPAWLLAWGTTMLIITNITIKSWPVFLIQLIAAMYLGVYLIIIGSNYFSKWMYRLFPDKEPKKTKESEKN